MANTYTFTKKPDLSEPGQLSNFAGVVNDGNRVPMGSIGSGIQTVDASASPVVSPIAFPSSSTTTLTIPPNATQLSLFALTNTLNVSESSSSLSTNYFTVPVGTAIKIDVGRMGVVYIKANTGAATGSSFYFTVI